MRYVTIYYISYSISKLHYLFIALFLFINSISVIIFYLSCFLRINWKFLFINFEELIYRINTLKFEYYLEIKKIKVPFYLKLL